MVGIFTLYAVAIALLCEFMLSHRDGATNVHCLLARTGYSYIGANVFG